MRQPSSTLAPHTWGHSVPRDYEEAVKWLRLAADQGDTLIQHHERQPPVAFQRVLQVEPDDGLLATVSILLGRPSFSPPVGWSCKVSV
jgi:TPR repeat protein